MKSEFAGVRTEILCVVLNAQLLAMGEIQLPTSSCRKKGETALQCCKISLVAEDFSHFPACFVGEAAVH